MTVRRVLIPVLILFGAALLSLSTTVGAERRQAPRPTPAAVFFPPSQDMVPPLSPMVVHPARPEPGALAEPGSAGGQASPAVLPCPPPSPDGREAVIIELGARPMLDRIARGSAETIAAQQASLERDLARIDLELGALPARITHRYALLFSGAAARVSPATLERIRELPYVAAVHPDTQVHAMLDQSVPVVGAPTAWSLGYTGTGVTVAIIDTGIDYRHPDLGGGFGAGRKVAGGWDFVNNDADPLDDNGHGTHVGGIVAGNGTVKGVAPGATLRAYKVLDAGGWGSSSNIIAAIELARQEGSAVANLSLGGTGHPDDPQSVAIDNAAAAGMLCVVSAGNSGSGYQTIGSPGTSRSALTVGATDKTDLVASYSSRGPVQASGGGGTTLIVKPEIVAPGSLIRSTLPNGTWGAMSGTSMAAPHVAGAVALVKQARPGLAPAQLKALLTNTAKPLAYDIVTQGAGRLDVAAAVQATVLVESANVGFGLATGTSTLSWQQNVGVRSLAGTSQNVALAIAGALPAGTQVTVNPPNVSLAPGATATLTVSATVDPATTPDLPDWPFAYETRLQATVSAAPAPVEAPVPARGVPVAFFKGPTITLTFDQSPGTLGFYNAATSSMRTAGYAPVSPWVQLLPAGTWDFFASWTAWQTSGYVSHSVIKPGVSVPQTATLDIRRSEATVSVNVAPVDEQHLPLAGTVNVASIASYGRFGASPPVSYGTVVQWTAGELWFSPMSGTYGVAVGALAREASTKRAFDYIWWKTGLAASETIPKPTSTFRRLDPDLVEPGPSCYWYRYLVFSGSGST